MPASTNTGSTATAPTVGWKVEGMDCASCVAKIETALGRLPGVSDIRVSTVTETLSAKVDESQTLLAEIEQRVAALGYSVARTPTAIAAGHGHSKDDHDHGPERVGGAGEAPASLSSHGHHHGKEEAGDKRWWETAKGRLVILSGSLLALAFISQYAIPSVSHWVYIGATVIGVLPVARRALAAARMGMPFTIEMLMTVAAAGALVIGAAEEAALVVFLFAVGEVLEGVAANRARASIRALGELVPKTAILEEGNSMREVPATQLRIGQTVLVRPGDRIPTDGAILSATSGIDESPVTGESVPRTKGVGWV